MNGGSQYFCTECGAPLDLKHKFCTQCGSPIKKKSIKHVSKKKYCSECGALIDLSLQNPPKKPSITQKPSIRKKTKRHKITQCELIRGRKSQDIAQDYKGTGKKIAILVAGNAGRPGGVLGKMDGNGLTHHYKHPYIYKAQEEDINKAVRSTSVRQEQDSENPVNTNEQEQDYKVAMQLARYDENEKSPKDKSMLGSIMDFAEKYLETGIPGQIVDALIPDYQRPGGFATFGASAAENKALDGGVKSPSYLDSLARESGYASVDAMTKQYGVKPSFSFGTKPGDVSIVTGKPYNFAGQSKKKDGTIAYSSWGAWTDDLSDSFDTGWNGGFTSEADIQAAMDAHDSRVNRGIAGYTTLSKDSGSGKKGGWDRSKVDAYKDLKAEKAGGYIDKTMVNGKKGPNYGNFVKGKPTDSKSSNISSTKYVPTAREIKELTGGLDDYNVKTKTKDPSVMSPGDKFMGLDSRIDLENKAIEDAYNRSNQADLDRQQREVIALGKDATAGNMEQREIDNQQRNERSKQALTASSTFYDDNNSEGPSQDSDTSYSGSGVGGWTAKGGFINKRTMTMSKTPPNKKKRGGLASRK